MNSLTNFTLEHLRLQAALTVLPLITQQYLTKFNPNLKRDENFQDHVGHIARVAFEIGDAFEAEMIHWGSK